MKQSERNLMASKREKEKKPNTERKKSRNIFLRRGTYKNHRRKATPNKMEGRKRKNRITK